MILMFILILSLFSEIEEGTFMGGFGFSYTKCKGDKKDFWNPEGTYPSFNMRYYHSDNSGFEFLMDFFSDSNDEKTLERWDAMWMRSLELYYIKGFLKGKWALLYFKFGIGRFAFSIYDAYKDKSDFMKNFGGIIGIGMDHQISGEISIINEVCYRYVEFKGRYGKYSGSGFILRTIFNYYFSLF